MRKLASPPFRASSPRLTPFSIRFDERELKEIKSRITTLESTTATILQYLLLQPSVDGEGKQRLDVSWPFLLPSAISRLPPGLLASGCTCRACVGVSRRWCVADWFVSGDLWTFYVGPGKPFSDLEDVTVLLDGNFLQFSHPASIWWQMVLLYTVNIVIFYFNNQQGIHIRKLSPV